jgi:hypothetical protein
MLSTTNESETEDKFILYLRQCGPCVHCYNQVCSSELIINNNQYPVNINQNIIIERKEIDINILALQLPHEILVIIYNDYFRPHKFAQLFNALTTNSFFEHIQYKINLEQFIKHFKIFLYTPIKNYIKRIDREFSTVITSLEDRKYTSVFTLINPIKVSIFLEILMYKYH